MDDVKSSDEVISEDVYEKMINITHTENEAIQFFLEKMEFDSLSMEDENILTELGYRYGSEYFNKEIDKKRPLQDTGVSRYFYAMCNYTFVFLSDALEKGYKGVYADIGYLYYKGEGKVERNYEKAIEYYKKGCQRGNCMALNNLSHMYMDGYGVEKNLDMSIYYNKRAIMRGSSLALKNYTHIALSNTDLIKQNITQNITQNTRLEKKIKFQQEFILSKLNSIVKTYVKPFMLTKN